MFKSQKSPPIVAIAVLTTITIISWVFFTLYRVLSTKRTVDIPPEILKPIDPTLNTDVLQNISDREYFEEGEVIDSLVVTPTPQSQEPSESFIEEEEPSPTPLPDVEVTPEVEPTTQP